VTRPTSLLPALVVMARCALGRITLTGTIGHSVRLDDINQFAPPDAWFTLDTVTLPNAPQLYFDTSAQGLPPRLYRLVQVP
jgi:hypothetical protein